MQSEALIRLVLRQAQLPMWERELKHTHKLGR